MNTKIISALPLNYTLSGDNKDASATQASDTAISFSTTSRDKTRFSGSIVRARLVSNFGIKPPQGKLAAELKIGIFNGEGTMKGSFTMPFVEWDAWEEKEIYSFGEDDSFKLLTGSIIRLYDSNVQDEYVGDAVKPMLELEVVNLME